MTYLINLCCVRMMDDENFSDVYPYMGVSRKKRVEFGGGDGSARLCFDMNGSERFQPGKTYRITIEEA